MQEPISNRIFTSWRGVVLRCLCVLAILVNLDIIVEGAIYAGLFGGDRSGTLGAVFIEDARLPAGYLRAIQVRPGEAAALAGIHEGDAVRFSHPFLLMRYRAKGERFEFIFLGDPLRTPHWLISSSLRNSPVYPNLYRVSLVLLLENVVTLAFAIVLLVKGWGRLPTLLLGLVMLGFISFGTMSYWSVTPALAVLDTALLWLVGGLQFLMPSFALALYEERIGPVTRLWRNVNLAFVAIVGVGILFAIYHMYEGKSDANDFGWQVLFALALVAPVVCFWRAWRVGKAVASQRFALLLIAFGVGAIGELLNLVNFYVFPDSTLVSLSPIDLAVVSLFLLFYLLLVYAALKEKLVDLGFAINRTLVYALVSTVLLVSFGILEWAAQHVMPRSLVEKSAWIDGGIAVVLFLCFHRVRDAVEHFIERVFFHRWHKNEAVFRRFVASAAHFEQLQPLCDAFAQELVRFTNHAEAALYQRAEDGSYRCAAGTMSSAAEKLVQDDPALALMRAERGTVDMVECGSKLPGALALPMEDHGALAGFVLLGLPASGANYRPDEVELLGWGVRQVGLDLQTLKVKAVEAERAALAARVDDLRAQNDRLNRLIEQALVRGA